MSKNCSIDTYTFLHYVDGVTINVLFLPRVRKFNRWSRQKNGLEIVIYYSPAIQATLSSKIKGSLACLLEVRIMFQSGAKCLPADCSVSDLVP